MNINKLTPEAREAVAQAFEQCIKHLWNGRAAMTTKTPFICYALQRTGHLARSDATRLVSTRLGNHVSAVGWLIYKARVPDYELTSYNIQQWRHAWVRHLIKELRS